MLRTLPCLTSRVTRNIWGEDFPIGEEWDVGATPPLWPTYPAGRLTVLREKSCFIVFFHSFHGGKDTLLEEFPPTEQGELEAKTCALAAGDTLDSLNRKKEQIPCHTKTVRSSAAWVRIECVMLPLANQ